MLFTNPIPSTVRKTPIRTRLGSARPTIDVPIATPEPRWRWPRTIPTGSATSEREPERRARELELLERLREQEARVVADEPERLDERVGRWTVVEDHVAHPRPGDASAAAEPTSAASQTSASATARSAGGVDLGLERRRQLRARRRSGGRARSADERGDRRDRDRRDDGDPQAADDRRHARAAARPASGSGAA